MNKKDLIPFKHILVTREYDVLLYVDSNLYSKKTNLISVISGVSYNLDEYDDNFVSIEERTFYHNPRKDDIMFIYSIKDFSKLIRNIDSQNFSYEDDETLSYLEDFATLEYERIDGICKDKSKFGYWKREDKWHIQCSECDTKFNNNEYDFQPHYCPKCGCQMR